MQYPNAFQAQTPIGGAIASLGQALLSGNPYQRQQMQAMSAYRDAESAHMAAQDAALQAKAGAAGSIGGLINKYHASLQPGGDRYGALADLATNLAQQGETQSLPGLWRAIVANQGGSDDDIVHAMAGAGNAIGVNDAVSLQGQNDVYNRNFAGESTLEGMRQSGQDRRQGMSDATSRANNADTNRTSSANAAASESGVKGRMIADLIASGGISLAQKLTMAGAQGPYKGELVQLPDGSTGRLDSNDAHGVVTPVPIIASGPRNERVLQPTNIQSTIGSAGSDPQTAARRTKEDMASSLGLSTQELDFVTAYENMLKSGGLLGQVNPPPESKARYDAIQKKMAARGNMSLPEAPLPPGLTPVQ